MFRKGVCRGERRFGVDDVLKWVVRTRKWLPAGRWKADLSDQWLCSSIPVFLSLFRHYYAYKNLSGGI